MKIPKIAKRSACWVPLNDPSGISYYQTIGNYLIIRTDWTARDRDFTVIDNRTDKHVLQTTDYSDVMNLIMN